MDNLRLILIIVASLAIIALVIHGFWINKKERSTIFNNKNKKNGIKDSGLSWEAKTYDDADDIGEVRVRRASDFVEKALTATPDETPQEIKPKDADKEYVISPVQCDLFSNIQEEDDNEEPAVQITTQEVTKEEPVQAASEPVKTVKNDVLVLHVTGLNGAMLNGNDLLNSILQSGFQFGDMQIFHRHVDPAGNGPVLFSLANMVKPGYLDPETMHDMVTPGISLFMMLPSFGDGQQNFKMMLQAAQRIADDVDGMVQDDEHHMITPQKIDSYKERIKHVMG
ncbi:cell division protein ZipA [Zophobihabitans entericus]|uniref:Cell division protein ZipA n=1 Tax=Zophobihabitans entericus TaxID=1635327 RepID=A0A6G9IBV2_9GAMM|nr:cell division protein ZipA [Zophobihabitans entericus]QIQ21194.1 cell division protein ZipA [Zophobihabitans entericus]